jgi:carbon starvation protein
MFRHGRSICLASIFRNRGTGPMAGPILAAQLGLVPSLLWIGFGVIFIGAVHDFSSLTASVRHKARSIAEITREHLGSGAGRAMMLFIWIVLVYVIIAFAQITAGTFVSASEELQGVQVQFNPGGAVAAASIFYLFLAVVMGVVQRYLEPPLWLMTAIFVPAALATSWLGTYVSTWFIADATTWGLLILAYCCVASVLPVWSLLQPRGYLADSSFIALGLGVIGVLFGGYEIKQPAFRSWDVGGSTGMLFPFLFVTIACGACSGFMGSFAAARHQNRSPRVYCQTVGYGAMLAEAFVALIAMVTIMIISADEAKGLAGTIYGNGIGQFMTLLIGQQNLAFAITFGAMAFSTFVFDTLDVGTRLGPTLSRIVRLAGPLGIAFGTLLTMGLPFYVIATGGGGTSYINFWRLFGASNQLLAALTLISITVWLANARHRFGFVLLPMAFVLVMTLWALGKLTLVNFSTAKGLDVQFFNGVAATALIALALYIAISALAKLRIERGPGIMSEAPGPAGYQK